MRSKDSLSKLTASEKSSEGVLLVAPPHSPDGETEALGRRERLSRSVASCSQDPARDASHRLVLPPCQGCLDAASSGKPPWFLGRAVWMQPRPGSLPGSLAGLSGCGLVPEASLVPWQGCLDAASSRKPSWISPVQSWLFSS